MFDKILIANRGEIALRILRACKELGVSTVAVHSTADVNAMHVKLADESVCIGPPSPHESYLNIPAIIAACEITGANAVHPGYGFLSENARFVEVLDHHKIAFIGPRADQIRLMGDKIVAKKTAARLGIPCVPGSSAPVTNVNDALKIVDQIGCPVLIKAVSGGGGRGMKIVRDVSELENAFFVAKMEARSSFGDDAVYIEKYLSNPRHIEIQVLGDGRGGVVHLGERECSLQRRHQKLWEEAFSPILTSEKRAEITSIIVKAMQEFQYLGLGTLEFLYSNDQFYFIEMNTRIQVEHPVTEMITGLDLVNEQIRVAAQKKLSLTQGNIHFKGHAIECRINAEHPFTFRPSPGTIGYYHPPGGLGVRVESAAYQGYTISPFYDSLIGKLIVHGQSRSECLMRLRRALDEFIIDGIETTLPLFRKLAHEEDVQSGLYNIHWLETFLEKTHAQ